MSAPAYLAIHNCLGLGEEQTIIVPVFSSLVYLSTEEIVFQPSSYFCVC